MGFFRAAHGWADKICHIYPTTSHISINLSHISIKLGTVIPYPKKIQKIYESRDTPLEFC